VAATCRHPNCPALRALKTDAPEEIELYRVFSLG
jgi:hypothetical protein